uniref:hypothetical protein n=1 Tax=Qipengyuania sp. TaxID=2004515 RepID=UPI0035C7D929
MILRACLGCGTPIAALAAVVAATAPISAIAEDGWRATMIAPQELALRSVAVQRQGFDATGSAAVTTETLLTTKRVRKPYPLHKDLTTDQVALSDYVYATDSIVDVVNNSTVISPKPVANWIMPHRLVVGSTLEAELTAFHRNAGSGREVACVEFIATDKDGATATVKVGLPVVSNRAGDRNAVIAYKANINVDGLAPGLIRLDAKVYPRIGDGRSIADSALDGNAARGFSTRYFLKNTGAKTLAYVKTAANGGSDSGSAVVSTNAATASASPFASVSAAISALQTALSATSGVDMGEIRVGHDGGTPFVLGATSAHRTQKVAALTITRDPAVPKANARVSFGAASFGPFLGTGGSLTAPLTTGALVLKDLGVVRTGTGAFVANSTNQMELMFDNCDFDNGGYDFPWINQAHDYHFGTTFTNVSNTNGTILNPANFEHRLLRGIRLIPSAYGASGFPIEGWCVVGSYIWNATFQRGTRSQSGAIQAFNTLPNPGSSQGTLGIAADNDVNGFAFVQNVIEYSTAVTGPAVRISADSATGNNSHVIIHNNTHAGALLAGRWNAFYDDGPTRRTSTLQSVVGNIAVAVFSKCDVFRGTNQSDASGNAQGNWAFIHGVGCRGNFSQFMAEVPNETGADRVQDYPGVGSNYGTSETVRNDPLFTDYR